MADAKSGCRANTIGTSMVEFTMVLGIIARPNHSKLADDLSWREAQSAVYDDLKAAVIKYIENSHFTYIDGHVMVEDISMKASEVRLHSDTQFCEHGD